MIWIARSKARKVLILRYQVTPDPGRRHSDESAETMSPVQPVPARQRSSRRQSRAARKADATESEANPLAHLRRRCVVGASISFAAYLAVMASPVLWPSALGLMQTISLEVGIGIVALLFTLVAIAIWLLTESTTVVLSVSKAASAALAANAALESELFDNAGTEESPIPIQRGQEIRRHRRDQRAV